MPCRIPGIGLCLRFAATMNRCAIRTWHSWVGTVVFRKMCASSKGGSVPAKDPMLHPDLMRTTVHQRSTQRCGACTQMLHLFRDQGSVYLAVARPRQAQIRDETVDVPLRSWVPLLGKVVCLDSRKRVLIRSLLSKNSSPRHVSRRCQQRRDRRK